MKAKKIIIIGSGIIGLTTALELSRRNISITLLDNTPAGHGASIAAGGILSPLKPWQCTKATQNLLTLSWHLWDALFEHLSILEPTLDIRSHGVLYLDDGVCEKAKVWACAATQNFNLTELSQSELRQSAPSLQANGGCVLKGIHQIEMSTLLSSLVTAVAEQGVQIKSDTLVKSLIIKKGQICAIETAEKEEIPADCFVVCAGAWTPSLFPNLPGNFIRPMRGQMIEYNYPANDLPYVVCSKGKYLVPCPSRLLVGSTVEDSGFDETITSAARKMLISYATQLVPNLRDVPVCKQWSGLRPGIAREEPLISAHPCISGLFVNSGHFRNGVSLATGSAQLLAQIICGETPSIDITPYSFVFV